MSASETGDQNDNNNKDYTNSSIENTTLLSESITNLVVSDSTQTTGDQTTPLSRFLQQTLPERIDFLLRNVSSPSPKQRALVSQVLTSSIRDKEFPSDQINVLVDVIFETLPLYQDRRSYLTVERAIVEAAKANAQFLRHFVIRIDRATTFYSKQPSSFRPLATLLRWSCALIIHCFESLEQEKQLALLISAQVTLLENIAAGEEPSQRSKATYKRFQKVFRVLPAAVSLYANQLLDPVTTRSPAVIAVFAGYCSRNHREVLTANSAKFLEVFVQSILSAVSRPSTTYLESWSPFLGTLSAREVAESLVPAIARVLKRTPEISLYSIDFLLRQLKVDLNRSAVELLTNFLPHLKSTDQSLRSVTVKSIIHLAEKVNDSKIYSDLLTQLVALIDGTPLPYVYQRVCVLEAILMLSQDTILSGATHTSDLEKLTTRLTSGLDAEVNEEVRVMGLNALAAWLRFLPKLPATVHKFFLTGLNSDKDAIRQARLFGLASALERSENGFDLANNTDIITALFKIGKTALTTTPRRTEGIASLTAISRLAAVDPKLDAKMDSEKLWQPLFESGLFLYTPVFLDRLVERDLVSLKSLYYVIVRFHTSRLNKNTSALSQFFIPLAFLLCHKDKRIRETTIACVSKLHSEVSADQLHFSNHLLSGLRSLLDVHAAFTNGFSTERHVLQEALGVAVNSATLDKTALPLVLFLSHHPLLIFSNSPAKLWRRVLKRTKWNQSQILSDNAEYLVEQLIGSSGVTCSDQFQRNAALQALVNITVKVEGRKTKKEEGEGEGQRAILAVVSNQVAKLLSTHKDSEPTSTDRAIYETPEGQLYTTITKPERSISQVQDKNVRRAPGQKGMYSRADEKWEEEVRKELLKKKGSDQPTLTKEEQAQRTELLAKESETRKRVAEWKHNVTSLLLLVKNLAKSNPNGVHQHLPVLFPTVFSLLPSRLVEDLVLEAITALYGCLSPHLQGWDLQQRLAISLGRLCGSSKKQSEVSRNLQIEFLINAIAHQIAPRCRGRPMSSASLVAVFPLLKAAIVEDGVPYTLQEVVLSLIEQHIKLFSQAAIRLEVSYVLIHLLNTAPRFESRSDAALVSVAEYYSDLTELREVLKGILEPHKHVRLACLKALENVPFLSSYSAPEDDLLASRIWFASSDVETENASIAQGLWKMYRHPLRTSTALEFITPVLSSEDVIIRKIAGAALAASVVELSRRGENILTELMNQLETLYRKSLPPKEKDSSSGQFFQRSTDSQEKPVDLGWPTRSGVALTFEALAPVIGTKEIPRLFQFMIHSSLGDESEDVRQEMVEAGMEVIKQQGQALVPVLLPVFEKYLDQPPGQTLAADRTRESVVIFLGGLARHLEAGNPKVLSITKKLIDTLKTPAESVQKAVSLYLSQLMPSIKTDAPQLVTGLLERLVKSPSYAERRGAAYGLAGAVKGLGLSSLKQLGIMQLLQKAVENKRNVNSRQGALFAFECLSNMLGRLFEPYVIHILEQLLRCFGDASVEVREATGEASKAIMGQLSAHGVKLVLPALLKALEDKSWRTKTASIELLGSMAFCAPRQLSACLPSIVPRLAVVLDDTNDTVQAAARAALGHIGSVIRNPEIQSHVPKLIQALDDPETFTKEALEALLYTNFVHMIDAPSLALIMPILQRGLRERSTEVKKRAAQIVGNMASLSDHKDLIPYLADLLPSLKVVLLDPIPEVRAIAAKALGSMVKGMGEDEFRDLIPWLLETMKSESGNVERSGAAQGLSEVLSALEGSRFDVLLPQVLANTNHKRALVREGYLTLFIFLPITMRERLQPYIARILPVILQGLADDEAEGVREVALRAGQAVVTEYANTSLDLLLLALEDGLFHDNWRIRQSSVQLLKDLLYKVAGGDGGEDAGASNNQGKAIIKALGEERRNSVLAALYMIRSDVNPVVRQKSLMVWKSVVLNTPKTLREILPVLIRKLIDCLGSDNPDKQQVAGRTLGDLVQKLGDRVMPDIIPILESGLDSSSDPGKRQGVCLGLSEVISAAGECHVMSYFDDMIPAIRKALCDPLEDVREAAAEAFNNLFKHLGSKAVGAILPPLLEDLEVPSKANHALEGLKQIVSVRSKVVLPLLIPKLAAPPLTVFNAKAIASIAEVAVGKALYYHLSSILPSLISTMLQDEEVRQAAETVVLSVKEDGVHILLLELFALLKSDNQNTRKGAASLVLYFCRGTKVTLENQNIHSLFQALFPLLNDPSPGIQQTTLEALDAVIKTIKKEEQVNFIPALRHLLAQNTEHLRLKQEPLPAFCLPKGLSAILPLFLYGLMNSSAEVREQAAGGLGEILNLTSPEALRPNLTAIAGPLIRVVGDRFPPSVKTAILQTLCIVLDKGGVGLKPFLAPLQTTFVKALQDPSSLVRSHASVALGKLMVMNARVDPLIAELLTGLNNSDTGVQGAMIGALQNVLNQAGPTAQITEKTHSKISASLANLIKDDSGVVEDVRRAAARCVGIYSKFAPDEEVSQFISSTLLQISTLAGPRQAQALGLCSLLQTAPERLRNNKFTTQAYSQILSYLSDDKQPIRSVGLECVGHYLLGDVGDAEARGALLSAVVPLLMNTDSGNDVKLTGLRVLKNLGKQNPEMARQYALTLVPVLMERAKDRSSLPLKLAAERGLFYLLQARKTQVVLQEVTQKLTDQTLARNLTDYFKRVLSKLPEQSDDDQPPSDL